MGWTYKTGEVLVIPVNMSCLVGHGLNTVFDLLQWFLKSALGFPLVAARVLADNGVYR